MSRRQRAHFVLAAIIVGGMIGLTLIVAGQHFRGISLRTRQAQLDAEATQLVASARLWVNNNHDSLLNLAPGTSFVLDAENLVSSASQAELTIGRTAIEGSTEKSEVEANNNEFVITGRVKSGVHVATVRAGLSID